MVGNEQGSQREAQEISLGNHRSCKGEFVNEAHYLDIPIFNVAIMPLKSYTFIFINCLGSIFYEEPLGDV